MPIPLRCPQCSKGLKVPDKYRGKRIKCPDCKAGINVPAGKTKQATKKKAVAPAPASDGDFLADLDFGDGGGEDLNSLICPRCATDMNEESDVCPNCGHNVATGQLDAKVAKKRSQRGPDPSEFYRLAWNDAVTFLKANFNLAIKTTYVWAIFGTLASIFSIILASATKGPIITFWTGLTGLATFAVAGWYWFLSETVIRTTMDREDRVKRLNVDVFQTLALGIKAVVWPLIMALPLWVLVFGAFYLVGEPILDDIDVSGRVAELKAEGVEVTDDVMEGLNLQASSVTGMLSRLRQGPGMVLAGIYIALYMLFPIAQIHLVSKYSYKATVLWELIKVVPTNIGPVMFWNLLALLLVGPIAAIFVVLELFGGGGNLFSNDHITWVGEKVGGWLYKLMQGREDETALVYKLIRELIKALLCFLSISLISFLASVPAVMLMRITGKFGVFRVRSIGIMDKTHHGDPAGFWVRYVAFAIDCFCIPFAALVAAREKAQSALSGLFTAVLVMSYLGFPAFLADIFIYILPGFLVVNGWVYYSVLESGTARASIGKENMRLVAETENGKKLNLGQASVHYFMSLLLLIAFPVTGFDPEKKSLADRISKCRVVWKGEG